MGVQRQSIEVKFPLNQFIHQLFFTPLHEVIWSPEKYWCLYKVQLLEQCLSLDYIQYTNFVQRLEYIWLKSMILEANDLSNKNSGNQLFNDPKDNHGPKTY